jgi:hypothetical protein
MTTSHCALSILHRARSILHCALCITVCLSSAIASAETIDRVLAVVGGVVITQSDATAAFELGLVDIAPTEDPMGATLGKLIDRQLMLTEVDRYAPPDPPVETIDRRMQSLRGKFPDARTYTAALTRSGIDEARLRQMVRDQIRIDSYLDQRFTSDRRETLIAEWVGALRRRTGVTYLYVPRR